MSQRIPPPKHLIDEGLNEEEDETESVEVADDNHPSVPLLNLAMKTTRR